MQYNHRKGFKTKKFSSKHTTTIEKVLNKEIV
jgi:hypothetical protein